MMVSGNQKLQVTGSLLFLKDYWITKGPPKPKLMDAQKYNH